VVLKRNIRAKRTTLRVDSIKGKLLVTLPKRAPEQRAWALIKQAHNWIEKQLKKSVVQTPFAPNSDIPIFGAPNRIHYQSNPNLSIEHHKPSKTIIVNGFDPQVIPTLISDWLWQEIQDYTTEKVHFFSQQIGKTVNVLHIKDLKSRWGSCSSRNNISLSWRLIFAPQEVVDYVCAHEVAHLVEMNHSGRFWNIVQQLSPNYKDLRLWLRQNSPKLHSYGTR